MGTAEASDRDRPRFCGSSGSASRRGQCPECHARKFGVCSTIGLTPSLRARNAPIEQEFGDGIMSAIDFDMQIERLPNPKGDRLKITMSGKFRPYKYCGHAGNVPEYGYKEG